MRPHGEIRSWTCWTIRRADQVGDPSAAQVTQLVGIILPFLLHNSVQIPGGKGVAPVSQALYQLRLPVLDRLNTTVETCVLPPISLSLSFLVPVSAFPGLFQHLVGVPFYRLPKTLGWPYSDAPLNGALIPDPPLAPLNLAPLLSLLRVLPFFTPPSVRNKVTNHLQGDSGCHYTLDAIVHLLDKGMRPGTKNTDGDIETTIGRSIGRSRTSPLTSAKAYPRAILTSFDSSPPSDDGSLRSS